LKVWSVPFGNRQRATGSWVVSWVVGAVLLGGCSVVGGFSDAPSGDDVDEGFAVYDYVYNSGAVPPTAGIGRDQTASCRTVTVVGVEDQAVQDQILNVARDARRLYSTKPVVVEFSAGPVIKNSSGGFSYPADARELRRETIP
jgi:hypothetical protein